MTSHVSLFLMFTMTLPAFAQVQLLGKVYAPRFPGADAPANDGFPMDYFAPDTPPLPADVMPLSNVRVFASLTGPGSEALGACTWEVHPSGWYYLTGPEGNYSMMFAGGSGHNMFTRPLILTNVFTRANEVLDRKVTPRFDYVVLWEGSWDEQAARAYYQTFTAKGTSVTHIGFKPVHDGVDGFGPGGQTILVSVHRQGPGTPDTWPQVGPTVPVLNVDAGGGKSYEWSVGFLSGEVPTIPGERFAVCLRPESATGAFQMHWRADDDPTLDCYRIGADGNAGFTGHDLWLAVSSDADGLLVPYNKRIQKEYSEFAGFARRWSQTYVAKGRSLAGVILYAATLGNQPGLYRQRIAVRVREGGPAGPPVGIEKIAIGNGNFTGDSSWGTFGLVYAPGEVPLQPGMTYALEFESIENSVSLLGYVNIKGVPSDDNPGFNPYRKHAGDDYPQGTAFLNGTEDAGLDLDMIVVEYAQGAFGWEKAVDSQNLLRNGDMETRAPDTDLADAWAPFAIQSATGHAWLADPQRPRNHLLRLAGGSAVGQPVDSGYVQQVTGLSHLENYRLTGMVRCSWVLQAERQCMVGWDPTGQVHDPNASTIIWRKMPILHSVFVPFESDPIRPTGNAISVWLRALVRSTADMPFYADFDDFGLYRVETGVPRAGVRSTTPLADE